MTVDKKNFPASGIESSCPASVPVPQRPISVFIIEDSQAMLGALLGMFACVGNVRVVGAATSHEWKMRWAREQAPGWDLLLLAPRLLRGNPLRVIERIKLRARRVRIAVLGEHVSPVEQLLCRSIGADKVFSKDQVRHFMAFVQELAWGAAAGGRQSSAR